jgi:predicted Zn-dependent protease
VQAKSGDNVDARFVAVGFPSDDIVRFVIIAPAGQLKSIEATMIKSVNTLKYLSPSEAAAVKPLRLHVVTVQAGDTAEKLAEKLPFSRYKLEQFRVLNGLRAGDELKPGQRIKLVE